MILDNENCKRIAIYFFFDKYGVVDKYVSYFLNDLNKNVDRTIIVVNGKLTKNGKEILLNYGEVLQRDNKGFDVWAYKTALEYIGWEALEGFDEVILLNSTIMGPIYPLEETFVKMSKVDLDFWGLTKYFEYDKDPFGCIPFGYIPDHIQSHFICCRKSLVQSSEFKNYWETMPMINNYSEAVGKHEAIFTKHFSDLGYNWDVSVNVDELRDYSGYPLMMCPRKLIEEYRCPIFKKRSFFHDIDDYLVNTTGEQTSEMYNYIKDYTNYDVDFIWETILRCYPQADIVKNLNLTYVLPKGSSDKEKVSKTLESKKVALVMHVYFPDLLDDTYLRVLSMPEQADIYLTTDTDEKKVAIEQRFENNDFNKFEVRKIKNRGRDVSSLLVGVKDVIMDYDYVCFAHDKKTAQVKPGTSGSSFAYKCFENTLGSKDFVYNIIEIFNKNPRLGLLTPPEPNHGNFFPTLGFEWGPNYTKTKELADELGLTIPISVDKAPVAPFGTMFWFRPEAMAPLYKKDWDYEDFPPEPNKIDGTLLHAIERIYPFIVQEAGYYPAIVMTDSFVGIEYNNLKHYVRGYNQVLINHGIGPLYTQMRGEMNYRLIVMAGGKTVFKLLIKNILKKILPEKTGKKLKALYQKVK